MAVTLKLRTKVTKINVHTQASVTTGLLAEHLIYFGKKFSTSKNTILKFNEFPVPVSKVFIDFFFYNQFPNHYGYKNKNKKEKYT